MRSKLHPDQVVLIVPTLNAGSRWETWLDALENQEFTPKAKIVIDSGSSDDTVKLAEAHGFRVATIPPENFDHGGTRMYGLELAREVPFVVYMTQDAILTDPLALRELLGVFGEDSIGAAYGRQLPRVGANPIEAHARLYNYPEEPLIKGKRNIASMGVRAAFLSNSFAAYRRKALEQVGGFPRNVLMAEDMIVAARLLLADWKISYVPSARVYHSHNYSILEEFKRYFDTGALHARESWLLKHLEGPGREGLGFIRSELKYLMAQSPRFIPLAALRDLTKLLGYAIGRREAMVPRIVKRALSRQPNYWKK